MNVNVMMEVAKKKMLGKQRNARSTEQSREEIDEKEY